MNQKIYEWGKNKGITIYKFFGIAAFIMGIIYSILIPVAHVPDENTHMQMIEEELGIDGYTDEMEEKYYKNIKVFEIIHNPENKLDLKLYFDNISYKFSKEGKKILLSPSIKIIRHLPASIGFYLGVLLDLPVFFCLQLAEIFSVIFYVFMGILTLKIIPIKKELMCAIMLLPMTLQQCSSVNYDSVLLPCCFLFIALILNYTYGDTCIVWKDLLYLGLLLFIISFIKITYIGLALLIFILPFEKSNLKIGKKLDIVIFIKKYKWILLASIICIGILMIFILPNTVHVKIVKAAFLELKDYCKILYCTIVEFGLFYCQSMIGYFGWFDVLLSNKFYLFVVIVLFMLSQCGNTVITIKEKMVFIVDFAVISILIFTALISHSFLLADFDFNANLETYREYIKETTYSLGIQGRYFLPYIFVFFLLFNGIKNLKEYKMVGIQILYYTIAFAYPVFTILQRYWI